jgi:hypothetical protein
MKEEDFDSFSSFGERLINDEVLMPFATNIIDMRNQT